MKPASKLDWQTEYLDSIISIKIVDDVLDAIDHIEKYGSNHTMLSLQIMLVMLKHF